MKPTDYIEWDNLKDIPFFLCQVVEDREKQDLDIYYLGKRVLHDYDHVGHYLRTAVILFRRVKSRTADWVNLRNLWTLRNCVRGGQWCTDAQQLRIHPQGCLYALPLPLQDGSASAVRQALAVGLPVAGLVPAAVADYLEQQQLYRVHTG